MICGYEIKIVPLTRKMIIFNHNMRKKILSAFLFVATMACAQTAEFFKPYVSTDLRLPSVPLVVNDP